MRLALAGLLLLGGCTAAGNIVGVVAGAAVGGATGNPAIGFGVGVATAAISDYTIRTVSRHWHQGEQDAIAAAAGGLAVGGTGPWRIDHSLPLGNEHGQLQVVRSIDTPFTACRELVFSVEEGNDTPRWYTATICRQSGGLEVGQRRAGGGALGLPAMIMVADVRSAACWVIIAA